MLHWYAQILPPDNIIPAINDGARVPMPPRLLQEIRQKFPTGGQNSIHLPASGFTVLRDHHLHMLINHGPAAGGHTHHDALSFELHAGPTPLAIDSGIGKTYDDPLHESWYTTPAAHNMLEVVGAKLDRAAAEGSDIFFAQSPPLEYFAATHHGYENSAGIIHRRHILFIRAQYFLVVEEIHATRSAELIWHLHTPLKMRQVKNGFFADSPVAFSVLAPSPDTPACGERSRTGEGRAGGNLELTTQNLELKSPHPYPPRFDFAQHRPEYQGREINWIPFQSTAPASTAGIAVHDEYAEIDWLQFRGQIHPGFHRFAGLLLPGSTAEFTELTDTHWLIHHALGADHILLPSPSAPQNTENFSFQGQCAFWRIRDDQVTHWAALGATFLRVGQNILHQSASPTNVSGETP